MKATVCEDPDDDKLLVCAVAANIEVVVNGDKKLRAVSGYEGVRMVSSRQFVDESILEFAVMKKRCVLLLAGLLSCAPLAAAEKAILAGGCFWCMEADFEKLAGVTDVVSGFSGGTLPDPTYNGNHEGHYEVVEITYDPAKVSYKQLLEHYWVNIDPFDAHGQFCDKGHSYLSAIFVANETQRKIAEESRQRVVAQFPNEKVITPILDAATFYPIKGSEIGHQDYYKKNPVRYKTYRWGCGRDARLKEIWGDRVTR